MDRRSAERLGQGAGRRPSGYDAAMRKLILVKHGAPRVDPDTPSDQWGLSDEGRARCQALIEPLRAYHPDVIIASTEPKAMETAEILGIAFGLSAGALEGLREHDRSNVPHLNTREFISYVELFFRRSSQTVLGMESAAQALRRFSSAVNEAIELHPQGNLLLVTHGTVLALYLESHSDHSGFALWRRMSLPSYAVMELPGKQVIEVVDRLR